MTGGQNVKGTKFLSKIIPLGTLIDKTIILLGTLFLYTRVYIKKCNESACVSMLALKINYKLRSVFLLFSATILSAAAFFLK